MRRQFSVRLPHAADLAPTYEAVCAEMDWPLDAAKLDAMRAANAAKLEVSVARIRPASTSQI